MKGKTKKIRNKYDINQNNFLHLQRETEGVVSFGEIFPLDIEAIV